jgi:ankyrin repeat protein
MNQPSIPPDQHAQQQQENQQQQQPQQQGEVHNDDDAPQVEEQQDNQQQDEVEVEVNAVQPPIASRELKRAVNANDTGKIISLVDAGESPNSVDELGHTIVMRALLKGKLEAAKALSCCGADLLWVSSHGSTALHYAASGGDVDCIEWVIAKISIDVNSTANNGAIAIGCALHKNKLSAANYLVEKGANLFVKHQNGVMAIDIRVHNQPNGEQLGYLVLQHAKDIRWSAAKECILLIESCQSPDRRKVANLSMDNDVDDAESIKRSARLAASS